MLGYDDPEKAVKTTRGELEKTVRRLKALEAEQDGG